MKFVLGVVVHAAIVAFALAIVVLRLIHPHMADSRLFVAYWWIPLTELALSLVAALFYREARK